jgi:hypothetical protein
VPRYDVTLDAPTTMKGTLIEVPPVGGIENGKTVKDVYMTEAQADFLATNPHVTVKKLAEAKATDLAAKIEKAKTSDEVDALVLGDERDSIHLAATNRKLALQEAEAPQENESDTTPTTGGGEAK